MAEITIALWTSHFSDEETESRKVKWVTCQDYTMEDYRAGLDNCPWVR